MPTPLDRAMQSRTLTPPTERRPRYPALPTISIQTHTKNLTESKSYGVTGFAGIVTAVAAWSIWGGDMFPADKDPTGDPAHWSESEMRIWLERRGLLPSGKASREDLLQRVYANLKPPRS
ncbi:hypothetical protein XPA_002747 [Xanthoria parietina]